MWRSSFVLVLALIAAADPPGHGSREALRKLNQFVGDWKGMGGPDKPRPDSRDPSWKESLSWSWKFKGDEAWLVLHVKDGKYLRSGEVRCLPAEKKYQLTIDDIQGQHATFVGTLDGKGYLTFERVAAANGETQQLTMNTAADGARFIYRYAVKPKGRTIFNKVYQVAANKEGESLAAKGGTGQGPVCIVTGGLGTITVSYKGKTYYVCCTGCRDAFNENPEKYIAEAAKK